MELLHFFGAKFGDGSELEAGVVVRVDPVALEDLVLQLAPQGERHLVADDDAEWSRREGPLKRARE